MRILFWIVTIPFLALAGAFAASNHGPVTLRLWPLPLEAEVPVFVAVLGAFLLGMGLTALWFKLTGIGGALARRRLARHERALEEETERLKQELATKDQPQIQTIPPAPAGDDRARRLIAAGDG
ncbi:MAG TPA: LapA family protein [Alphaproteobacteria bacterium]|nr:LapA family protein [Alphaproteobacteria bacterium]